MLGHQTKLTLPDVFTTSAASESYPPVSRGPSDLHRIDPAGHPPKMTTRLPLPAPSSLYPSFSSALRPWPVMGVNFGSRGVSGCHPSFGLRQWTRQWIRRGCNPAATRGEGLGDLGGSYERTSIRCKNCIASSPRIRLISDDCR